MHCICYEFDMCGNHHLIINCHYSYVYRRQLMMYIDGKVKIPYTMGSKWSTIYNSHGPLLQYKKLNCRGMISPKQDTIIQVAMNKSIVNSQ
ncbi:hypothetical protein C0J52_22332 [Blattella germanica]|nr:hypothetical protein C0J52_22332 [Blattella germanica]